MIEYDEPRYHCVFPQADANVDALPRDWRQEAQRIVEYIAGYLRRNPDRIGDRLHCGCCCGHSHKILTDAEVKTLQSAGFIVELE